MQFGGVDCARSGGSSYVTAIPPGQASGWRSDTRPNHCVLLDLAGGAILRGVDALCPTRRETHAKRIGGLTHADRHSQLRRGSLAAWVVRDEKAATGDLATAPGGAQADGHHTEARRFGARVKVPARVGEDKRNHYARPVAPDVRRQLHRSIPRPPTQRRLHPHRAGVQLVEVSMLLATRSSVRRRTFTGPGKETAANPATRRTPS